MPQIARNRGLTQSYGSNNRYAPSYSGYCMREKEEILRELSSNLMGKMYEREVNNICRTYASCKNVSNSTKSLLKQ